jgi:hypothetical protein
MLVIFPTLAYAQVDVDKDRGRGSIVGKWIFDSKKSSGPDSEHKGELLVITYEEPRLTIERTLTLKKETKSATMVLFTDKRGEKNNPSPFNPSLELSSSTEWQDNILVRLYNMERLPSEVGKPRNLFPIKESYEIKDGGNVLVVTIRPIPRSHSEVLDQASQVGMVVKRVCRRVV